MLLVTQKKIVKRAYRAWSDLAKPLGRENLTHSEGVQLFRSCYGLGRIPVATMLATNLASVLPPDWRKEISEMDPAQLDQMFALIDTEEKFEACILSMPEPSPEQRELILSLVDSLLPSIGKLLVNALSKQFPHKRREDAVKNSQLKKPARCEMKLSADVDPR